MRTRVLLVAVSVGGVVSATSGGDESPGGVVSAATSLEASATIVSAGVESTWSPSLVGPLSWPPVEPPSSEPEQAASEAKQAAVIARKKGAKSFMGARRAQGKRYSPLKPGRPQRNARPAATTVHLFDALTLWGEWRRKFRAFVTN